MLRRVRYVSLCYVLLCLGQDLTLLHIIYAYICDIRIHDYMLYYGLVCITLLLLQNLI